MTKDPSLVRFLKSLEEKPATTVRFFDFNDFYSVYYSDAILAAKEIFKTTAVVKHINDDDEVIDYVTLSIPKFEIFLRELLLVKAYRVEIYKNKGHGKTQGWSLESKASPGNLSQLEDQLFNNQDLTESKGIIAIKVGNVNRQQIIGITHADVILRKFQLTEFTDNDFLSNLQSIIVHLNPKECLMATDNPLYSKIKEVVSRCNILITECKSSDFNSKDLDQDLKRLLKGVKDDTNIHVTFLHELDKQVATGGLSAIIKYLELLSDDTNFGHYTISSFNLNQYARIDNAAVKALGLLPVGAMTNRKQSLLGLLNCCRTAPGQRLCHQWIKQPLLDVNKINERLNIVEAFVNDTELRRNLYEEHLRKFPDMHQYSKKFLKKKATLQECYRVYQAVQSIPGLVTCLEGYQGDYASFFKSNFISPLEELSGDFAKYIEMVDSTLDMDLIQNGEFMVKADFDDELQSFREEMTKLEESMQLDYKSTARNLGLEQDKSIKLENCAAIGYAYRVTRKEEKVLRNKKGYITIDTKQNGVRFHSTKLQDLNASYVDLRRSYEEHQKAVVEMIINIASGYNEPMLQLGDAIAYLDVLVSFAEASVSAPKPYVRPKMQELGTGKLVLRQVRHPCLEVQDNIDFIPNDVTMSQGEEVFNIITGPNMGGKSTYIRSIALTVLMAQLGCFVPCEEAEISVVDAILTRVGAGDFQLKGVSTFMAEMLESANIVLTSTHNSLVIIDELGRGTSTYDGFGLAWAISEHLAAQVKCFCLFATHFHEMTALANQVPVVKNYHVTALTSGNELTFLYTLKPGSCDQSFGVHVAEMAQFPSHIIELARKKVQEFEEFQVSLLFAENTGEEDPEPKKQKIEDERQAQDIIDQFLSDCKKLAASGLSPEELLAEVQKLKDGVRARNNPRVERLIASICC